MPLFRSGIVLGLALCAASLAAPVLASAQTTGEIRGTVTDASSQRPISGAAISLVGTTRSTVTDARGTYTLRAVPAGNARVRASILGYSATERAVAVAAGATATVDLALSTSAVQLEGVVVSASGREQRVRELGNAVSTIQPSQTELATTQTLSQLLTARAPGLVVQSASGTAGTTSRVRIRGANSVSLSNEPLLIIDGVRVDNSASSLSIGLSGQTTSRFDDINPEDVESIEVIKGPAGVALYGTAAANGVIQVTTKRGRAGRTRWTGYAEYGTSRQTNNIPLNYAQAGTLATGANAGLRTNRCLIENEVRGLCTPRADSLYAYSPLIGASPFRDGIRRGVGLSVSGGSQAATYYIAVDREGDDGIVAQNEQRKTNLRANLRGQLAENLTVDVSTGYLSSRLTLPFGDNSSFGAFANGIRGSAYACRPGNPCVGGQGIGTGTTPNSPLDSTSFGYQNQFPPSELEFIDNNQDLERFIGSANINWRPLGWLAATGVVGMDINNRYDHQFVEPNRSTFNAGIFEGSAFGDRRQIYNYTANGTLTATRNLFSDIVSTSSLGAQ
jgi:TonB-dependent SusC/RagA subfamily outer membrane receptor